MPFISDSDELMAGIENSEAGTAGGANTLQDSKLAIDPRHGTSSHSEWRCFAAFEDEKGCGCSCSAEAAPLSVERAAVDKGTWEL